MTNSPLNSTTALLAHIAQGHAVEYVFFWGHRKPKQGVNHSCFSQWYEAPFKVDGDLFLTAEHYMMAGKAALFGDQATRQKILRADTPDQAKKLGRKVNNFDEAIWQQHRFEIVVAGNLAKFSQHAPLRQYLLSTGDKVLVEASPVDQIWGIGLAKDDPRASQPEQWNGLNLLGFALISVREQLKN